MANPAPEADVDPTLREELAAIERLYNSEIIDQDERRTQRKEALDAWRQRQHAGRFPPGCTDSSPAVAALVIPTAPAPTATALPPAATKLAAPAKAGNAGRSLGSIDTEAKLRNGRLETPAQVLARMACAALKDVAAASTARSLASVSHLGSMQ